jgi:N6-adenosine-specific RNA methylase IME4
MSNEQIRAINVRAIAAQNSHLYLWTTNSFLVEAHEIVRAWGFEPKTLITWRKLGPIGLGRYFRGVTEHIVFGVRGRRPLLSKSLPNFFEARKRGHSVKPDEAYALIERASPGPRLEMFARAPRAGWTTWGLEADGAIHQNQALINPKVGGQR